MERKKVYPYEGEPKTLIESTERQVFEVVAKNVHDYVPNFEQLDNKGKRFSFGLLRHAIESGPSSVRKILQNVLELPDDKANDLANLLEKTSLSAIINASTVVANRLSFLHGLEMLLYDPKSKEQLLERAQLQKILEDHTWVFGEQYALSVADQSLNAVLEKHIDALDRDAVADYDQDVLRPGGQKGIVDLMLSRRIPQPQHNQLEHLVVELKRPKQKINGKVIDQVTSYAEDVANDERFRDLDATWNFWVVSNDYGQNAKHRVRQKDRPIGLVHEPDYFKMKVWAVPWSTIIQRSRGRLQFFQEKLEYSANDEDGLAYLRTMHEKYLPPIFLDKQDSEDVEGSE